MFHRCSECNLWSVESLQLLVCSKFTKNIIVTNNRQTIVSCLRVIMRVKVSQLVQIFKDQPQA